MRTLSIFAAVLAVSCGGKKADDDKGSPQPKPTSSDKTTPDKTTPPPDKGSGGGATPDKPADPAKAGATVPVTSKSPDAIKEFEAGRDLVDNDRNAEAIDHFKKAIAADADFAQAHAYLGIATPGPDGMTELDKAKTLAAKLPEPERLLIEAAQAGRNGKHADMIAAYTKMADLAPADWRVWMTLGNDANERGDNAKAIKMFEKALAIKADLGLAHDGLAYAHAGLREWDAAIAAAKKQIELTPKQPSPQDTLGEMLLLAGKYEDAEKAFKAALEVEPKYIIAWQGIALSRGYRGDWKGAFEANESHNTNAPDTEGSVNIIRDGAWLAFAAGDLDDAIKRFDVVESDAEAKKVPAFAFAALDRGEMLLLAGKNADAVKWLETGGKRREGMPGFSKHLIAREHAIGVLRLAALTAKPDEKTDKMLAGLDQNATAGGDPTSQSYAAWGHGLAAWAKTGAKDAVADLSKCRVQLLGCRFDLAAAQRKAGDTAGADATEKQIREAPQREASAVYFVTAVTPAATPPATPPAKTPPVAPKK